MGSVAGASVPGATPPYPAGIRPFRAGDEVEVRAALLAAHERGEFEGIDRHWIEDSAERMAEQPGISAIAEVGGHVAGWICPHHDDLHVDLPYRRRGIGRNLVAAGRVLAPRLGLPYLRVWVPRRPESEAFATAAGLRYHSSLWRLQLDPSTRAVPPSLGAGWTTRPLVPGEDDAAFVDLVNEIFLDHPFPLVLDLERIRVIHAKPGFDASSVLLVAPADEPDALAGFCRVGVHEDDAGERVGEVKLLGVRRRWRGRGLARELVRWGIAGCAARGAARTLLAVEGENAGALRLYESEGFGPEVEWPHWVADPL